jgi:hypothetical protein
MSRTKTVYTEVEVDVDISEFDTDDLIEELKSRDSDYVHGNNGLIEKIWILRREGRDYQAVLDELIYNTIGKII